MDGKHGGNRHTFTITGDSAAVNPEQSWQHRFNAQAIQAAAYGIKSGGGFRFFKPYAGTGPGGCLRDRSRVVLGSITLSAAAIQQPWPAWIRWWSWDLSL